MNTPDAEILEDVMLMPKILDDGVDFVAVATNFAAHPAFEGLEDPDALFSQMEALRRQAFETGRGYGGNRSGWEIELAERGNVPVREQLDELHTRFIAARAAWTAAHRCAVADLRIRLREARSRYLDLRRREITPDDAAWPWYRAFSDLSARVGNKELAQYIF